MRRARWVLLPALVVLATSGPALAQWYTIVPGAGTPPGVYDTGAVYTVGGLPPTIGPGAALALAPPPPGNPVAPPGTYIVDALSSGADAGDIYLYSATFGVVGLPATPVAFEVGVGTGPSHLFGPGAPLGPTPPEAEGDIFVVPGPVFGIGAGAPLIMAPGYVDEFALGLNVGGGVAGDDLNALSIRGPAVGQYYSLAAGGLGAGPFLPADIVTPFGAVWAGAFALSLVAGDDLDAMIIQDLGVPGVYDPADFIGYSLAPGSPSLLALGFGPGDLLLDVFGAGPATPPILFVAAAGFGLAPGDNLDAVDVFIPLPAAAWVGIVLLTGLGAVRQIRRRVA